MASAGGLTIVDKIHLPISVSLGHLKVHADWQMDFVSPSADAVNTPQEYIHLVKQGPGRLRRPGGSALVPPPPLDPPLPLFCCFKFC